MFLRKQTGTAEAVRVEDVLKYNPHHGKGGRFSSGPGGGSGGGAVSARRPVKQDMDAGVKKLYAASEKLSNHPTGVMRDSGASYAVRAKNVSSMPEKTLMDRKSKAIQIRYSASNARQLAEDLDNAPRGSLMGVKSSTFPESDATSKLLRSAANAFDSAATTLESSG